MLPMFIIIALLGFLIAVVFLARRAEREGKPPSKGEREQESISPHPEPLLTPASPLSSPSLAPPEPQTQVEVPSMSMKEELPKEQAMNEGGPQQGGPSERSEEDRSPTKDRDLPPPRRPHGNGDEDNIA